jgi:hypothetical protein
MTFVEECRRQSLLAAEADAIDPDLDCVLDSILADWILEEP